MQLAADNLISRHGDARHLHLAGKAKIVMRCIMKMCVAYPLKRTLLE